MLLEYILCFRLLLDKCFNVMFLTSANLQKSKFEPGGVFASIKDAPQCVCAPKNLNSVTM